MIARFTEIPLTYAIYTAKEAEACKEINICRNDVRYSNFAQKDIAKAVVEAQISNYSPITAEVGDTYRELNRAFVSELVRV